MQRTLNRNGAQDFGLFEGVLVLCRWYHNQVISSILSKVASHVVDSSIRTDVWVSCLQCDGDILAHVHHLMSFQTFRVDPSNLCSFCARVQLVTDWIEVYGIVVVNNTFTDEARHEALEK